MAQGRCPESAIGGAESQSCSGEHVDHPFLLCGEDSEGVTHATNQFWGLFQEENDHRPEPGAFLDQGEVVGLPPHRHGS